LGSSSNYRTTFSKFIIGMKYSVKENKIVLIVAVVLGLYDFFTIPFNSFLIACVFSTALYCLTKSLFSVAFVFFIPQLIRLSNIILGRNEGLQNPSATVEAPIIKNPPSTQQINTLIQQIKNKYEAAKNENFTNKEESDENEEKDDTIEGNASYPEFMREGFMGTNLENNSRIEMVPEEEIPVVGTVEKNPRANNVVESYDDVSINTALERDSTKKLSSSNVKSVDMTM